MLKNRPYIFLLLTFLTAANAQPVPQLKSISPEWMQRGTTADVIISGENLSGLTDFAFSGDENLKAEIAPPARPKVRLESANGNIFSTGAAKDDKRISAKLIISEEASLGSREVRVITPGGISNPLTIRITDTPEINEAGGKHSLTNAQEIEMPIGILGKVGEADQTDFFKFHAAKNESVIFDVQASRIGSALDSSLAILDSAGKELAKNEDAIGMDSFLIFPVPADGDYFVTIRDFEHRGAGNYDYHLTAGTLPYVESIFPFGGQRGKEVNLKLSGVNLEGAEKMKVTLDENAPGGTQEIRAHTAKGFSNPRQFDVSFFPDTNEKEPNNLLTNANEVVAPGNVNGRISKPKETDFFKFKADKGQRFIFEIYASRFGSKLDPLLTLQNAKGEMIQQNDDAMGADARIDQAFAEAGEYFISVRDLLERGGENFGYRISIDPPAAADFSGRLLTDSVRLHRGGRSLVRVEVTRSGFGGAIEILPEDLPKGVTCSPLVIPAEFPTGLLLFSASEDAELGTEPLVLKAVAVLNGKRESRSLQTVVGGKIVKGKRGAQRKVEGKAVAGAYLTVLEATPFTADWVTLSAGVEQNESTSVMAEVERRNGFSGDIKVSLEGFSAGNEPITRSFNVEPGEIVLKGNDTRAQFKLTAKLDSETGSRPIFVRTESAGNIQYSRSMPIRIGEFPYVVTTSLPRLTVTAPPIGATNLAAAEAELTVKFQKRGLFTENVNLTLEGMPDGVTFSILQNTSDAEIKFTATDKAKPSTNTVVVVGSASVNGRDFKQRAPGIQFIVNAMTDTSETAAAK